MSESLNIIPAHPICLTGWVPDCKGGEQFRSVRRKVEEIEEKAQEADKGKKEDHG